MKDKIKDLCTKLGKSNKPIYAVIAIATVKGIARPIITMMDKHEDPETKKYTAMREGLTEVVAIPTYWACGELTGKIGEKLKLSPDKQAIAKHNFMFLGVCAAALFVIPALASLTIKPFMKKIQGDKGKRKVEKVSTDEHKLDIKEVMDELDLDDVIKEQRPSFEGAKRLSTPYQTTSITTLRVGAPW